MKTQQVATAFEREANPELLNVLIATWIIIEDSPDFLEWSLHQQRHGENPSRNRPRCHCQGHKEMTFPRRQIESQMKDHSTISVQPPSLETGSEMDAPIAPALPLRSRLDNPRHREAGR